MILNIWGLRGCFLINNILPCIRPSPFPKLFQAKRRWPLWIRTVLCQLIPVPPLTRSVSLDVQLRATVIVSWLNLSQWSWWIRGCAEHSTIWSSTHVWFSLWGTLGEQRKLQTTEPKGIRHAISSDTHPWPQFTSHSKPRLSMAGFSSSCLISGKLVLQSGSWVSPGWFYWEVVGSLRGRVFREVVRSLWVCSRRNQYNPRLFWAMMS